MFQIVYGAWIERDCGTAQHLHCTVMTFHSTMWLGCATIQNRSAGSRLFQCLLTCSHSWMSWEWTWLCSAAEIWLILSPSSLIDKPWLITCSNKFPLICDICPPLLCSLFSTSYSFSSQSYSSSTCYPLALPLPLPLPMLESIFSPRNCDTCCKCGVTVRHVANVV